ncbi:Protein of unknown function [Gryllus bimaculatus]|nr:Protein of unknown function [Gryllus bimaculatus]
MHICSGAEGRPPENDLATQQRSGQWGPGPQENTTALAHLELQLHEGQGEEPVLSAMAHKASSLLSIVDTLADDRLQ